MLKKVLKYDLKSIFKYWWIGAVASFALSLLGSVGISFFNSEKEIPIPVEIFSIISIVLSILGYVAFIFLAQILVFVRYYKNFYSDEGYLTFTLPVKRASLFNSKLIMGSVTSVSTALFCLLSASVMLIIGFRNEIFTKETYDYIVKTLNELFATTADVIAFVIGSIELIILGVLLFVLSNMFMYLCISIGATISKKAKVVSAIGVYYAASSIGTFLMTMFSIFVSSAFSNWTYDIHGTEYDILFCLILLILIFFVAIICTSLYAIHYILLDKKLNLS